MLLKTMFFILDLELKTEKYIPDSGSNIKNSFSVFVLDLELKTCSSPFYSRSRTKINFHFFAVLELEH